jgi:dihydroflavonol-4-reductase
MPNEGRSVVLVTGASGHLGGNLVRALVEQGRKVRALVHRQARAIDGLPVEAVQGDLLDGTSLALACAGVSTVFHLAASVSAGWERAFHMEDVNVRGTENIAQACLSSGVRRLVHFSSIQALSPTEQDSVLREGCPLVEQGEPGHGRYDLTKAAAERAVLAAVERGLDATILNPTGVLGPFDFQPSAMGQVLRSLGRGEMPALVSGGYCDFVDVRDVCAAALAAELKGRRGERYLLSGERLSMVDLAHRWAAVTGRPAPRLVFPMSVVRLAAPLAVAYARIRRRRPLLTGESLRILRTQPPVDRAKAEFELGFAPRPIERTLRDTCEWMKQQGWL